MMDANEWLALATAVYAAGTLCLAYVTSRGSVRAARTAQDTNKTQIEAAAETTASQIEASQQATAEQIAATAATTEKQIAAAKDAARIEGHTAAISQSRQGWINQLRDEVTGFLTEAGMRTTMDNDFVFWEGREAEAISILRSMKSHLNKVRLLINPTEGESTQLVEMLQRVYDRTEWGEAYEDQVVAHTQSILKTEWERVKRGD